MVYIKHTNPSDPAAATSLAHSPSRPRRAVLPARFRENGWRRSAPWPL